MDTPVNTRRTEDTEISVTGISFYNDADGFAVRNNLIPKMELW